MLYILSSCSENKKEKTENDTQKLISEEVEIVAFKDDVTKDKFGNKYQFNVKSLTELTYNSTSNNLLFEKILSNSKSEKHIISGVQQGGIGYSGLSFQVDKRTIDEKNGDIYIVGHSKSDDGTLSFDDFTIPQNFNHFFVTKYSKSGKVSWARVGNSEVVEGLDEKMCSDYTSRILDIDISNDSLIFFTGFISGNVFTNDNNSSSFILKCEENRKNVAALIPSYCIVGAFRKSDGSVKSIDIINGESYYDAESDNKGTQIKIFDNKLILSGSFMNNAEFPNNLSNSSNCNSSYTKIKGYGRYSKFIASYDLNNSGKLQWVKTFDFDFEINDLNRTSINILDIEKDAIYISGHYKISNYKNSKSSKFLGKKLISESSKFIAKLDLKGKLVWYKEYADTPGYINFSSYSNNSGNLYFYGYVDNDSWSPNSVQIDRYQISSMDKNQLTSFTLKMDKKTGDIIWLRTFNLKNPNDVKLGVNESGNLQIITNEKVKQAEIIKKLDDFDVIMKSN
jgi:hypothetical protein